MRTSVWRHLLLLELSLVLQYLNPQKYLLLTLEMAEMIHYLKNKVGVVDFENTQELVMSRAQGSEGPTGFEILPIHGLL